MFLGIWLVLCQQVSVSNLLRLGTLVYDNRFTRNAIMKVERHLLGFPARFSLEKNPILNLFEVTTKNN